MYEKLLTYLSQKPALYAPSTSAFWDDENISKYMLEAHLNPDWDAASRKQETIDRSVDWITRVAPPETHRDLMDLGCGPGLYAERFADKGYRVTGMDFSHRSIEYAKEHTHGDRATYLYGNYLEMDFENAFDIITLIYCDFGVLSPDDRQTLLKSIKRALRPGGLFILDAEAQKQLDDFKEGRDVEYNEQGFWSAKPHMVIESRYLYPESANYVNQYVVATADGLQCYNIWNQIYDKKRLLDELTQAGYTVEGVYDDIEGSAFTGEKRTLCAVVRA